MDKKPVPVNALFGKSARLLAAAALVMAGARTLRSHETLTTTVLFDREIVRVLDRHCVMCHAEKSIAFPLETYEQTWVLGRKIRAAAIARHMPPWAAFPGYGQFANDNSLTLRESQFVVSWVEGLGPRNGGKVFLNVQDTSGPRPAAVRARPRFDQWQTGTPDLTRQLPARTVDAGQHDGVQRVTIDLGLTAERRIRALEFMPGDRRVVRAAFFSVRETGQWLGSWTPWHTFMTLPEGVAYRVPAGAHVVAEIHVRGTVERVEDRGTLGLFFDARPSIPASDLSLTATARIPAGQTAQRVTGRTRIVSDTVAVALRPEIDEDVESIEVSSTTPAGSRQILLFARDIPSAWPTPYIFSKPVRLAAGSQLSVTAYVANRSGTAKTENIRLTVSGYPGSQRNRPKS